MKGDAMKNHENKLLSSISRIDDDILDSALAYKPKKSENKVRTISIKKKITAIALAAVMCIGLVVTVSAYGNDIWAAITQRKRELIDDKSQIINESVTAENGCSLTVDNVIGDGASGIFYFSIHSGDEPFAKGLKFEQIQLMYITSPDIPVTYAEPVEMGEWYVQYDNLDDVRSLFGGFDRLEYDSASPVSTVQYKLNSPVFTAAYKLVIRGITSEDGSIKYADELEIEFNADQSKMQSLAQIDFHCPSPKIEFELEGHKYQVYCIGMSPYKFSISITNEDEDIIEYNGTEYYGVSRFDDHLWLTKEWFDYLEQEQTVAYSHPEIYSAEGASEEIKAKYNELKEKETKAMSDSLQITKWEMKDGKYNTIINHQEPYSMCYNINVELYPECGASCKDEEGPDARAGTGIAIPDINNPDMVQRVVQDFNFTSPIYITDIKRVYVTKNSDPDFELTIYEPSKDTSLFDSQNAE